MTPDRYLVVRAGALGDTLMATPVVRAIAESDPAAEIDVLCSAGASDILRHNPHVARVHALKWRNVPLVVSPEKRRLVTDLKARAYDVAVLLERAPRYREIVERAGVPEIRSFREMPFDESSHAIFNNLRAAGLEPSRVSHDMDMFWSEEDAAAADRLLEGAGRPLVGVHIGYGPSGKKKDQSVRLKGWKLENFRALVEALLADGVRPVMTGSAEDRADVARVADAGDVLNVAGRTSVGELAAVIAKLDVFVSIDSGPAHMAAAVGTPLVVLWGPAILEQVRPVSAVSPVTVIRHVVPCAPCYETPLMKSCRQNVCMEGITPAEVHAHVREQLAVAGDRRSG